MDQDAALFILDQLGNGQAVSPADVQSAANTLSHYVGFLELLSAASAVADARSMLALLGQQKKKSLALQYAIVTVLGDDFVVDAYDPGLDPAALRLAERELSRILRLRFITSRKAASYQRLADVIGDRP
jgi:hypothetical protein